MSRRSPLFFLPLVAMLIFVPAAFADCDTECNPYFSYCSQECDVCTHWNFDVCETWGTSTCGNQLGGCLQDDCTPNWYESSRTNVGTYAAPLINHCDHHKVDSVTNTDDNQCNVNSTYWSYASCDDYVDDYKDGCCYPSCCDGYGVLGTSLTCNGNHNCS